MAFPSGNQKKDVKRVSPAKEVKENKVSDIKQTKEVKLNLPKKTKAINTPSFNEKAVQIRFAEIDYNSNKKISLKDVNTLDIRPLNVTMNIKKLKKIIDFKLKTISNVSLNMINKNNAKFKNFKRR